jgi:polyisoprenyl-teichoic acid--peptidoglycan teichoic acid transferase
MACHAGALGSLGVMLKRFLIGGVAIALLSGAATATVALNKVTTIANEVFPGVNRIRAPAGVIAEAYGGSPQTFLLIGSDKRPKAKSAFDRTNPPHSDTLLLVRLDPNQGQTSVLSIPRDLLAKIVTPGGQVYYPEKINAAYTIGSYMKGNDGGARLAAETVEHLLGIKLNGVVDATFKGFIEVVDSLGCVYINVDHRYYNPEGTGFSAINLQPGYQRLCYENALSYVRYRHTDSDFVRVARQQDFIRNLREQVSPSDLLGEIDRVSKAVGRAITTTFPPSASELIKLTKLIVFSQEKPLRQVKFRFASDSTKIGGADYVTATPQQIHETVEDFLHGDQHVAVPHHLASTGSSSHGHGHAAGFTPAAIGLYPTSSSSHSELFNAAVRVPFPVIYPSLQTGPAVPQGIHTYTLKDQQGHTHHAFIEVFQQNGLGGYYDVEGMDWTNPPIVNHVNQEVSLGGRHYMFVDDGSNIHVVAWREGRVLYWVNNTLREDLTNPQMINIAQSAHPLH